MRLGDFTYDSTIVTTVSVYRCVKCCAKILRLKQHHGKSGRRGPGANGGDTGDPLLAGIMAQSASNYSMSQSSSNHSFASGVSSVSSASSASSVRSVRSFNFDTLSNFQNVNLMNHHKNGHHVLTRTTVRKVFYYAIGVTESHIA